MAADTSAAPHPPFNAAFERLKEAISQEDARTFASTTMQDVWKAARDIENQLEARRSLRGFRRLQTFLTGIEQYSKVIETLCNQTPYLPYIWAPIKLMLQVSMHVVLPQSSGTPPGVVGLELGGAGRLGKDLTSQASVYLFSYSSYGLNALFGSGSQSNVASYIGQGHISALEKLVDAYAMIGEAMPRFDRLSAAFKDDVELQQVMGLFYEDILEFHRRAYKFFRQRAWKMMFDSLWKTFNLRFQAILDSLRKHRDLIDQEANIINLVEAKAWRNERLEHIRQWRSERAAKLDIEERERINAQVREAAAWLNISVEQEDILAKHLRVRADTEPHWILKEPKIISWLEQAGDYPFLWLNGKIGGGKSFICSKIVEHLQGETGTVAIFYFCHQHHVSQNRANDILRCFASQLFTANTALAPYILETFASNGLRPTKKTLGAIIEKLVTSLASVRIIVDGLDEWPEDDHKTVIDDLLKIKGPSPGACKVLLSSRNVRSISKPLQSKPFLRLEDSASNISSAITRLIDQGLEGLRERFSAGLVDEVGHQLSVKANGVFLWVKLILFILDDLHFETDVEEAVKTIPEGLPALYESILTRMCGDAKILNQRRATQILQWVLFAKRPLKKYELESGIILDDRIMRITKDNQARGNVLSLCSPLLEVEDGPAGIVSFFHFTVIEYLRTTDYFSQLQDAQAQTSISLSCALYLESSLDLADPQITDKEKHSQILLCLHDLHLYANDHWLDHMLALVDLQGGLPPNGPGLLALRNCLERLTSRYNKLVLSENGNAQVENKTESFIRNNLWHPLNVSETAQTLLNKLLVSQNYKLKKDGSIISSDDAPNKNRDPTIFSNIRHIYQRTVEELLERDQLNDSTLLHFRSRYESGAFFCRYQNCAQSTQAFRTSELRQAHEESHSPRYRCTDATCSLFGWKFKTRDALAKHASRYHQELITMPIPKSIFVNSHQIRQDKPAFALDELSDRDNGVAGNPNDKNVVSRQLPYLSGLAYDPEPDDPDLLEKSEFERFLRRNEEDFNFENRHPKELDDPDLLEKSEFERFLRRNEEDFNFENRHPKELDDPDLLEKSEFERFLRRNEEDFNFEPASSENTNAFESRIGGST